MILGSEYLLVDVRCFVEAEVVELIVFSGRRACLVGIGCSDVLVRLWVQEFRLKEIFKP